MVSRSLLSRWQMPRLDTDGRWIGGVCAALAKEIGVQPLVIRGSFVVLAFGDGWGLLLYAATWALLLLGAPNVVVGVYSPQPKGASSFHRHIGIFLIVLSLLITTQSFDLGPLGQWSLFSELVWPVGFVVVGGLIAWTQGRDAVGGLSSVARIIAGVVVAVSGLTAFGIALTNDTFSLVILGVVIVLLAGLGVVIGPSLVRMGNTIDQERSERIRSDERAQVAAHLHDSVLQTLSLIQRHSDNRTQVVQLARQQERELRGWLYGTKPSTPGTTRVGPAIEEAASHVESLHGLPIEVVSVGDTIDYQPEDIHGLVAASREAMVNASIHSQADKIDVFVECGQESIDVFVRDTGVGFDPARIAGDRRGVSESIVGRMKRIGGRAVIDTEVGLGTEVELSLPTPRSTTPVTEPTDRPTVKVDGNQMFSLGHSGMEGKSYD